MNTKNKRRNNEVALQLGEPLPLPYKVDKNIQIKEEDDATMETRHNSRPFHEPIPFIRNVSSSQNHEIYLPENLKPRAKTINLAKPRPVPILRDYLNSRVVSNERILPKIYDTEEQLQSVDSIAEKLDRIRKLVVYREINVDCEAFQKFDGELSSLLKDHHEFDEIEADEQLQPQHEPTVLEELESLQRISKPASTIRYIIIITSIIFFLISSFIVSGLNYEYCYYFC
ncbi:uncharacterized protein AC631_01855 [Debaryomyces fabryi]|uniref:Uncharacterized protein n=1 Tax=Debaryomyces fabryi TaxID=58627 RepID=A0A0V1Q1R0_9ASCO|nr:uncharacterized protein AC631_01855 [Debaryomyces fabryi]KSA02391.1 hypothetical protein AC631_01855 [Debaryomyces fabryi]CUM56530.1 unnamed protein product [Debaryomyces fabryi]